jgi:acyl-CoA synthetase (AMP-forming)/AMP-acid ligase II
VGEVVVTGDHVGKAYMNDPQAERANKIKDGAETWHRTGDAARLDSQGRLWLMGRVSARVERLQEVWWPMVAEAAALQVPGVSFAAYLGRQDASLGQRALLCVETATGALEPGQEAQVRAALGRYPIDELLALKNIPRDPRHASKVDLQKLNALLGTRHAG